MPDQTDSPQFGVDGCTCIPFTRQTDPPRYLNRPTDTVDMISGWERGGDCPHHAPAAGVAPADDQHSCSNCEGVDPGTCLMNAGRESAADQAARRDRYAAAMARRDGDTWPTEYLGDEHDYRRRADAVMAVADAEQAELRRERDLAVAHDRQPYPTAWAYEQACDALRRKTEAIERVRALHARVLRMEALVCAHCGHAWPCDTMRTLGGAPPAAAPAVDRAADVSAKSVTRAIFALKSPPPPGSQHYRSGWDDGLEAAIDAARDVLSVVPGPASTRAETLRAAADELLALHDSLITDPDVTGKYLSGIERATTELRRLADEAQSAECPNLYAQEGVTTPGCDCGHHGMGMRWHRQECSWMAGLLATAREVLAKDDLAHETQPETDTEAAAPDMGDDHSCAESGCDGEPTAEQRSGAAPATEA